MYQCSKHARIDSSILDLNVRMRFVDNAYTDYQHWLRAVPVFKTLKEILTQVLAAHARGISFREHNAGPALDAHMSDQGFLVQIHVDWETGLVYGGNEHNCGTWMDKMGSVAGVNHRVPSTPRNGANVEINALCLYTLKAYLDLVGDCVLLDDRTVSVWCELLSANFDRMFYNPHTQCYKDCMAPRMTTPSDRTFL